MERSNLGPGGGIGIAFGTLVAVVLAACATGSDANYGDFDAATVAKVSREAGASAPSSSGASGSASSGGDTTGASSGNVGGSVGDDAGSPSDDAGTSGNDAAACSTSCKGCCDPTLGCTPGTDNTACGLSGVACTDCTGSGQTCQSGTCGSGSSDASSGTGSSGGSSGSSSGTGSSGRPRGMCGLLNCLMGCCQNGTCVSPPTNSACGMAGMQCRDCTSMSQTCNGGRCR